MKEKQKETVGLFISDDALSEYLYKTLIPKKRVFPFSFEETSFTQSKVFQFGDILGIISTLKQENIDQLGLIGRIPPSKVFGKDIHISGKTLLNKEIEWKSEELMISVASKFEEVGIQILPLTCLLPETISQNKVYTSEKPNEDTLKDIKTGISFLKNIINFRAGQSVVIKKGVVVAVEGVEGTDLMIKRAGEFCENFTVIKIAGKNKNEKFDLPVVGPDTAKVISEAGGKTLAIETGKTIFFEKEETIDICEKGKIILLGVEI